MSTKRGIQEMLVSMGFPPNYIARAFKVYEKNYGHNYNIEVITEIIVRLQNKDKAKHKRKVQSPWNNELSFDMLKTNGLVNVYNEWMSVKHAFGLQSKEAVEWLNTQKIPFRKSRLSHVLICGYGKGIKIPLDVRNIIISYCNLMFIKLFYASNDNNYDYRALDTNITIRDLAKILEIEKHLDPKHKHSIYSDFVHIFCRFGSIKHIYTMKTHKMQVTLDMLKTQMSSKWVEVPDDYMHLHLKSLDDVIEDDNVLEIGVDTTIMGIMVASHRVWSFKTNVNYDDPMEWVFSLQIGDIIDVWNSNLKKWCHAVIRYISYTSFYIHYIGYDDMHDVEIDATKQSNFKERYSNCQKPKRSKSMGKQNVNEIQFCWRTDMTNLRKKKKWDR